MTQMMLRKQELRRRLPFRIDLAKFFGKQALLKQLLLEPDRHCHAKGGETLGRKGQIGFEQAFEFQERLIVEDDMVDAFERAAGGLKAIGDRLQWKARIMLLAGESLFLCCRNDAAILHDRGSAIMVEGRDAENMQRCSPSEDRIDERRHRSALGQNEQAAENRKQHQKRQQPDFLAGLGESEEFHEKRHADDLAQN